MDEEARTCGRCKGKALLEGVEEHSTNVTYTAARIPLGSERVEGGARITYVCSCGNRFTFISRLRRARFLGSVLFGALFGGIWWYLGSWMDRRDTFSPSRGSDLGALKLVGGVCFLVAFGAFLAILADAYSRLRNRPWRGE
jgi:hypothetical protein